MDYSPAGDAMVVARDGKLEYPAGKVLYDPGPDKEARDPRFSPDGRSIAFIEQSANAALRSTSSISRARSESLSEGWETTTSLAWNPRTGEIWFSAREFASFGVVNLQAVRSRDATAWWPHGPLLLLVQDIARDGRVLLRADDWTETTMGLAPGAAKESDLTWLDDTGAADLSGDGQLVLLHEGGVAEGRTKPSTCARPTAPRPCAWEKATRRRCRPTGSGRSRGEARISSCCPPARASPGSSRLRGSKSESIRWFPDGKKIYFDAASPGKPTRLYEQDVAGGAPRPIGPEGFVGRAISPDGKFIAGRNKDRKAGLLPLDGSEIRLLAGAPEGRILRFDSAGTGLFVGLLQFPPKINRHDIATGRTEPWRELAIADPAGLRAVNNIVLTPDGKSYAYTFWRALGRLYVVRGLK